MQSTSTSPLAAGTTPLTDLKPHLRGWSHLVMAPLALAAGIVLTVLAPPGWPRAAAAAYALTSVVLFGVSAAYHRGHWSERAKLRLKRMDHSNIFLIIAGTYTPMALFLTRNRAITLLAIVWGGALLGVLFRVFWTSAPRWLYVPLYILLGWVAVFFLGDFARTGGAAVVALLAIGGVLYTAGAVCYGFKKPNPWPKWWGFHEFFHAGTVAAWTCHCIAAFIAVLGAPWH